jgi:general secretion pathway protein L
VSLFIHLGSSGRAGWVKLDADGEIKASGEGPLSEIDSAGERVTVLVPGEDVLLCSAAVPGGKRRLLAQAVPYALEEQLVDDVEAQHFAFGSIDAGRVNVAVVSQAKMEQWLAALREAGIEPEQLIPDVLALPLPELGWQVMHLPGRCLIKWAAQSGSVTDPENVRLSLKALLEERDIKPERIGLIDYANAPLELHELGVELDEVSSDGLAVVQLARSVDEKSSINLLQGPYSRRERISKFWRPWRAAAALLLAWLVVQLGATIVEHHRLAAEKAALDASIEQIYRQTFPQARKVVNAKLQMERALDGLRGGGSASSGGFGELLARAGEQFSKSDKLSLQRLSYKNGLLDVSLFIGDLQQLDQLKQRLADQARLQVEIQSASTKGDQVEARLRIREAAS